MNGRVDLPADAIRPGLSLQRPTGMGENVHARGNLLGLAPQRPECPSDVACCDMRQLVRQDVLGDLFALLRGDDPLRLSIDLGYEVAGALLAPRGRVEGSRGLPNERRSPLGRRGAVVRVNL